MPGENPWGDEILPLEFSVPFLYSPYKCLCQDQGWQYLMALIGWAFSIPECLSCGTLSDILGFDFLCHGILTVLHCLMGFCSQGISQLTS